MTEDFGPSQFMRQLCAIVSVTVFLLNFAAYINWFSFEEMSELNAFTVVFWSLQQFLAMYGLSISTGRLSTKKFNLVSYVYTFCEWVFWMIFLILVVVLFFGLLGIRLADENGIKQISYTIASSVGAQLL